MARKRKSWRHFKAFNLKIKGITRALKDRSLDVTRDGKNDDFPQYMIRILSESPHASACMERLEQFVEGRSLSVEDEPVNNNGGTWGQDIHPRVVSDWVRIKRAAIRIIPSLDNRSYTYEYIPADLLRYHTPDEDEGDEINTIVYNAYTGTDERRKHTNEYLPLFTSYEDIPEQREKLESEGHEYVGHVLFYQHTNTINRVYSRPAWLAGENWIKADARIGEYHDRNAANNFFLGGLIYLQGDPNEELVDKDGDVTGTRGEEFEEEMTASFAGTDNAGVFMTVWDTSPDGSRKPDIIPWPGSSNTDLFRNTLEDCRSMIGISMGVPEILLPRTQAGRLGQTNERREAMIMLNEITKRDRDQLSRMYSKLLPGQDIFIEPLQATMDIPESIIGALPPSNQAEVMLRLYGIQLDGELGEITQNNAEPNQVNNED